MGNSFADDLEDEAATIERPSDPPKYTDGTVIILVYAYLHQYSDLWLPQTLTDIISMYCCNPSQHVVQKLQFDLGYSGHHRYTIALFHNRRCARIQHNHRGSTSTASDPVVRGKHCWRFHIHNPRKGEIMIGVTKHYSQPSCTKIFGVSSCKFYFPEDSIYPMCINDEEVDLLQFRKQFCLIDLLLDIEEGVLKVLVVGDQERTLQAKAAVIWNLPVTQNGWKPYVCYEHALDATLRVAKIPHVWYGQSMPIWIEATYMEKLRAVIWNKEARMNRCYTCGASRIYFGGKLFLCGQCKQRRYCSVKCQRKDWKKHKRHCRKS